ncbi:hypothetical protein THAOC_27017, partial [Thalassiosira oceanica]
SEPDGDDMADDDGRGITGESVGSERPGRERKQTAVEVSSHLFSRECSCAQHRRPTVTAAAAAAARDGAGSGPPP